MHARSCTSRCLLLFRRKSFLCGNFFHNGFQLQTTWSLLRSTLFFLYSRKICTRIWPQETSKLTQGIQACIILAPWLFYLSSFNRSHCYNYFQYTLVTMDYFFKINYTSSWGNLSSLARSLLVKSKRNLIKYRYIYSPIKFHILCYCIFFFFFFSI